MLHCTTFGFKLLHSNSLLAPSLRAKEASFIGYRFQANLKDSWQVPFHEMSFRKAPRLERPFESDRAVGPLVDVRIEKP